MKPNRRAEEHSIRWEEYGVEVESREKAKIKRICVSVNENEKYTMQ